MSVMGSQLEIDMDPDGDLTVVPRHQGQTGTGCYKLHDHRIYDAVATSGGTGPGFRYAPSSSRGSRFNEGDSSNDSGNPDGHAAPLGYGDLNPAAAAAQLNSSRQALKSSQQFNSPSQKSMVSHTIL